uniref:Uncharacterized protein n=1 Tax=Panagrolaimus sp. ES5 TaxID=591445 RepID=A0AC34F676_9BILA
MKRLIILNFIGFVAAFLNGTLVLLNKNGDRLGYGIIVAPDTVMIPNEEIYHSLDAFARVENNGSHKSVYTFSSSTSQLKRINDGVFIIKLSNQSKVTEGNRSLRLSRYPLCENSILKTLSQNISGTVVLNFESRFQSLSNRQCKGFYNNFDSTKQICGATSTVGENEATGTPLVTVIDSVSYLVGLLNQQRSSTKLFDLVVEKCDTFPKYPSCEYLFSFPEKYVYCNSREISKDLSESNHSEIVLIGSNESGNKFVPSGFAIIISDYQAIAFSDFIKVLEQIQNPEIYGSGEEKAVAVMGNDNSKLINLEGMSVDDIGISDFKLLLLTVCK